MRPGHGGDFELYCAAIRVADAGGNPYATSALRNAGAPSVLPVTNPPIFVPALRPLCTSGNYVPVWVAAAVLTVVIIGLLDRSRDWILLTAVVAGGFEALGWMVQTGNIAPVEMLLVGAALMFWHRGHVLWFSGLLGAATFLKVLPGVFAVVPSLTAAGGERVRGLQAIAAVAATFVLLHLLNLVVMPELTMHYWRWMFADLGGHVGAEAIFGGVAHPSMLSLFSDASASLAGRSWPALLVWVLFCSAVGFDLLSRPRSLAVWCLGLLLVFPRLKPYSFGVALVPLYLGAKALPAPFQIRLLFVACAVPILLNGLSDARIFGYGQLFALLGAYLMLRQEIYSFTGEKQRT